MRGLLALLASSILFAQGPPGVTNGPFETRPFSGGLDAQLKSASAAWFGYAIKTARHDGDSWDCGGDGNSPRNATVASPPQPIRLEGSDTSALLFRVTDGKVEKIRLFSLACSLDAGGLPFIWLTGVPAQASLSYLEKLISADSPNYLTDGAVFAISQHDDPQALNYLIESARNNPAPHVREQALFWLSQKAGQRAAAAISDAILNDPDTAVKKRAVFALSQLPKDEGVPKLIEVARTQRNAEVRKQAFFWLGQSHDPRALAYIEDVLTK